MLLLSRAGIRDRANGFQSYWDYRTKGLLLHTHIPSHTQKGVLFWEGVGRALPPTAPQASLQTGVRGAHTRHIHISLHCGLGGARCCSVRNYKSPSPCCTAPEPSPSSPATGGATKLEAAGEDLTHEYWHLS